MEIKLTSIGIIHSPFTNLIGMPIQPSSAKGARGYIELKKRFVSALADLNGFSHIYLIYYFHKAKSFKEKVIPYLDNKKRGLFSTRSPSRPNPIGLSVVKLLSIEENRVYVENLDILDGTPLIDIKPYVHEMEAVENLRSGWLEKYKEKLSMQKSDARFT